MLSCFSACLDRSKPQILIQKRAGQRQDTEFYDHQAQFPQRPTGPVPGSSWSNPFDEDDQTEEPSGTVPDAGSTEMGEDSGAAAGEESTREGGAGSRHSSAQSGGSTGAEKRSEATAGEKGSRSGVGEGSSRSSGGNAQSKSEGKRSTQSAGSHDSRQRPGGRGSASASNSRAGQRQNDPEQEDEEPTDMRAMLDEMRALREDIRTALAGPSHNGKRRGPRGDQTRRDTSVNDFHVRQSLLS